MSDQVFDEFAERYDSWFLKNPNVLESELRLIRHALGDCGDTLSVGCGSGLFEMLLRREYELEIVHGVEPSEDMAAVARQRGMDVQIGRAEELPCPDESFDTVLFNGSPGYIADLATAFEEAMRVLRPKGHVVVADVPAESGYGLLYQLAATRSSWGDPVLREISPAHPYPIELAAAAHWRTTAEKVELLRAAGFVEFRFAQTLTRHPRYSDQQVEEPSAGYDRGGYVTIDGRKPAARRPRLAGS